MQKPIPAKVPYRPQIRRVSHRELEDTGISNEWDTSYGSSATANRLANRSQYPITPQRSNSWRPAEPPQRIPPNDDDDKKCWITRGWMICFGGIFCLILIVAVVAIVLGIVLPMTTASPDSNATKMFLLNIPFSTASICSNNQLGLLAHLSGTSPSQWISYSYSYTATATTSTVFFGFEADLAHVFILDEVSIMDTSAPSLELLNNPSFEDSTMKATSWNEPCHSGCTREIASGSECSGGALGKCLKVSCPNGNPSKFILSQSIQTILGKTYTISFKFHHQGNPNIGRNSLYLNLV